MRRKKWLHGEEDRMRPLLYRMGAGGHCGHCRRGQLLLIKDGFLAGIRSLVYVVQLLISRCIATCSMTGSFHVQAA